MRFYFDSQPQRFGLPNYRSMRSQIPYRIMVLETSYHHVWVLAPSQNVFGQSLPLLAHTGTASASAYLGSFGLPSMGSPVNISDKTKGHGSHEDSGRAHSVVSFWNPTSILHMALLSAILTVAYWMIEGRRRADTRSPAVGRK